MGVRIDRPIVPDGYGVTEEGPYLEWADVEDWLTEATEYWLASTRPDGRPHVVPRWGVWLDERFWYDGSPETRHARNLSINPACALHLESGTTVTIVEGASRPSQPIRGTLGERLAAEYSRKYEKLGYAPAADAWSDEHAGGMRVLTPDKAIAWTQFPADMTRYVFTPST
ncbi:MAG TPA: pyridoxamine 5'-phosphate oxidase family protein [Acidimicrobiia bacterium]